jgi:hypothetical protein
MTEEEWAPLPPRQKRRMNVHHDEKIDAPVLSKESVVDQCIADRLLHPVIRNDLGDTDGCAGEFYECIDIEPYI